MQSSVETNALEGTFCRMCGCKLSLMRRLSQQDFCSPNHRAEFFRQRDVMEMQRLMQSNQPTHSADPTALAGLVRDPLYIADSEALLCSISPVDTTMGKGPTLPGWLLEVREPFSDCGNKPKSHQEKA